MEIKDCKKDSKVINLVVTITSVPEVEITENGKKVQECLCEDDTGQIILKLWEEYTGKFKVGDKVILNTGWCSEFKDEPYVSPGLHGRINLIPKEKVE